MYKMVFLLSILVFMRCKTSHSPAGGSEQLYQHKWIFVEVGGKAIAPSPGGTTAFLTFTPGQVVRVTGFTGCNNLTGTGEISSGNGLRFSPLATTKMFCADAAAQEQSILTTLQQVTNFSVAANTLLLLNGTSTVASLKAE